MNEAVKAVMVGVWRETRRERGREEGREEERAKTRPAVPPWSYGNTLCDLGGISWSLFRL